MSTDNLELPEIADEQPSASPPPNEKQPTIMLETPRIAIREEDAAKPRPPQFHIPPPSQAPAKRARQEPFPVQSPRKQQKLDAELTPSVVDTSTFVKEARQYSDSIRELKGTIMTIMERVQQMLLDTQIMHNDVLFMNDPLDKSTCEDLKQDIQNQANALKAVV